MATISTKLAQRELDRLENRIVSLQESGVDVRPLLGQLHFAHSLFHEGMMADTHAFCGSLLDLSSSLAAGRMSDEAFAEQVAALGYQYGNDEGSAPAAQDEGPQVTTEEGDSATSTQAVEEDKAGPIAGEQADAVETEEAETSVESVQDEEQQEDLPAAQGEEPEVVTVEDDAATSAEATAEEKPASEPAATTAVEEAATDSAQEEEQTQPDLASAQAEEPAAARAEDDLVAAVESAAEEEPAPEPDLAEPAAGEQADAVETEETESPTEPVQEEQPQPDLPAAQAEAAEAVALEGDMAALADAAEETQPVDVQGVEDGQPESDQTVAVQEQQMVEAAPSELGAVIDRVDALLARLPSPEEIAALTAQSLATEWRQALDPMLQSLQAQAEQAHHDRALLIETLQQLQQGISAVREQDDETGKGPADSEPAELADPAPEEACAQIAAEAEDATPADLADAEEDAISEEQEVAALINEAADTATDLCAVDEAAETLVAQEAIEIEGPGQDAYPVEEWGPAAQSDRAEYAAYVEANDTVVDEDVVECDDAADTVAQEAIEEDEADSGALAVDEEQAAEQPADAVEEDADGEATEEPQEGVEQTEAVVESEQSSGVVEEEAECEAAEATQEEAEQVAPAAEAEDSAVEADAPVEQPPAEEIVEPDALLDLAAISQTEAAEQSEDREEPEEDSKVGHISATEAAVVAAQEQESMDQLEAAFAAAEPAAGESEAISSSPDSQAQDTLNEDEVMRLLREIDEDEPTALDPQTRSRQDQQPTTRPVPAAQPLDRIATKNMIREVLHECIADLFDDNIVRQKLFAVLAMEAAVNPSALGELTGIRHFLRQELERVAQEESQRYV